MNRGALFKSLPFALALLVPIGGIRLALHPAGIRLVLLPLFVFGLVPLLDVVMGRQKLTLEEQPRARDARYDVWLWLWVPIQLTALSLAVVRIGAGTPESLQAVIVEGLSMGVVSGLGINVAHELMHRPGKAERALAEVLMTAASYTHFCVEHVYGHHKHVATPDDPASARLNESVYRFLPRTLWGSAVSAWRIEGHRIRTAGIATLSLKNRQLRYPLVLLLVYLACFLVGGPRAVLFFALQSAVGILLLEVINYIEHYGLSRQREATGRYQRCDPTHSWNASERLTNWFLFHLQRHADHHALASRPFASLRHLDESPQMPTGYAGMILLALVPPVWKRVMNARVAEWKERGPSAQNSGTQQM